MEDPKKEELESLAAIYSDMCVGFDYARLSGIIEIPLKAEFEVRLMGGDDNQIEITKLKVANLPPLLFKFSLPQQYPSNVAPVVSIESSVVSEAEIARLNEEILDIWSSYKDHVLFSMVDHVIQQCQNEPQQLVGAHFVTKSQILYHSLLEFNKDALEQEFANLTITCEICQDVYKGQVCLKFDSCGHVFCKSCLNDYFTDAITAGRIENIHCPDFECTKKFVKTKDKYSDLSSWTKSDTETEDIVTTLLKPPVLLDFLGKTLQGDNSAELVDRYFTLYKKAQYEFIGRLLPNRMVNCPWNGCDEVIFRGDLNERLVVCPRCKFAFCNDCHKSWHARFVLCKKVLDTGETYWGIPRTVVEEYIKLSSDSYDKKTLNARYGHQLLTRAVNSHEMDLLFNGLLKEDDNLNACPSCKTLIEKTDGCNFMKCNTCNTKFCFICGLAIYNYDHFNSPHSACYGKLFFGMPGVEEGDVVEPENIPGVW